MANHEFPFAPSDWSPDEAERVAGEESIQLTSDHLELIAALQEYFSKHDKPDVNVRELADALNEKFHTKGGRKYLYGLLPGGPVAIGCKLAGLPVPAGAVDKSFGSAL